MGGIFTHRMGSFNLTAGGGGTPAQFVGGKSVAIPGTTGTTNISLTDLTGGLDTEPSEDDIVIVAYVVSTTSQRMNGVTTSGYRRAIKNWGDDTADTNLTVDYKFMGVSPDTSVTVSETFGTSEGGAVSIHVWRGVSKIQPFESGELARGNNTGQPDPPSATPTTSGAVVLVVGGGSETSTAPTDFTSGDLSNFFTASQVDTNTSAVVGMGSASWTSGAFDPAAWGGGSTRTACSWSAATLALRPVGADISIGGFSFVGGKVYQTSGSTSGATISLTDLLGGIATSPSAGDLVIVAYATISTSDQAISVTTSGYTTAAHLWADDSADTNLEVAYKVMSGSPDTSVDISQTFNSGWAGAVSISVWRGVDGTTPLDVATTTATGVNGGQAVPPSITPSTAGSLVIGIGAAADAAMGTLLCDMAYLVSAQCHGSNDSVACVVGARGLASGATTPPACTGGSALASASWAAATLALRPA